MVNNGRDAEVFPSLRPDCGPNSQDKDLNVLIFGFDGKKVVF